MTDDNGVEIKLNTRAEIRREAHSHGGEMFYLIDGYARFGDKFNIGTEYKAFIVNDDYVYFIDFITPFAYNMYITNNFSSTLNMMGTELNLIGTITNMGDTFVVEIICQ